MKSLTERLAALSQQHLQRTLYVSSGLDFASNDYLGFADEGGGAKGSRLLGGHHAIHEQLEHALAVWTDSPASLLYTSGYMANMGLLSALLRPCDRVISDQFNHASIIDGIRLSGAQKYIVPHNEVRAIDEILSVPHNEGDTYLVTESLFGMDGDQAPLLEYARLCREKSAYLIVDEAHAAGLYGEQRLSGLVEQLHVREDVWAVVHTFGKSLGGMGAVVSGSRLLKQFLVSTSRTFLFTTGMHAELAKGLLHGLNRLSCEGPSRAQHALFLARKLRNGLRAIGCNVLGEEGPIVPWLIGESERALQIASALQQQGFDVRAIRPPTVAQGTARIRFSVHAQHTEAAIEKLIQACSTIGKIE